MELVRPALEHLPSYRPALERGWSPDSGRPQAGAEELEEIELDADGFLASLDDPEGSGPPVVLPDGTRVPRLPDLRRFIRDQQSKLAAGATTTCC